MMNFRQALEKTEYIPNIVIQDENYSLDEALNSIDEYISNNKQVCTEVQPHEQTYYDGIDNIFNELKDYWKDDCIMDRATYTSFYQLLKNSFNLEIPVEAPDDDTDNNNNIEINDFQE
jgi:hypothetical protein